MTTGFAIGDMRVDRIIEREEAFLDAHTMFPALTADELDRQRFWLESVGALVLGTNMLTITVQSYLVRTPHHTVLVDTCVGNDKDFPARPAWNGHRGSAYMDALARAGASVDDIDFVLCTHLHVDHVGWNTRLVDGRWVPTFPNARYLFGREEYAHWEAQNRQTPSAVFAESVLPVVEAGQVRFVASDEAIDDHLRLLSTPGHTPGHVAALLGRERDEALITGDILHSPLQVSRPDLSPMFDADPVRAATTRRDALARMADGDMLCCAAHFPSPSVTRITRKGETFRCEPAS